MADKLTQGKIGNDDEAHAATPRPRSASDTFTNALAEIFNPLEAVEVVFEEPRAGLVFLALVTGVCAIAFIAGGLWSAVQELPFGGGPPMGLGLK